MNKKENFIAKGLRIGLEKLKKLIPEPKGKTSGTLKTREPNPTFWDGRTDYKGGGGYT